MIIKEIASRRSIRQFTDEPVSDEDLEEIVKAAQFAPTERNTRAWEFVIVRDQKIKDKIFEGFEQPFLAKAPALIIPVIDEVKTTLPIQDLSIASAFIFLQTEALGLGAVWENVNPERAKTIREILGIPDNFMIINIIPLGHPAQKLPPHTDNEFQKEKLHPDKF